MNLNVDSVSFSLHKSNAIVTGGASGIGEAVSRTLAKYGATVTIADLNEERGQKIANEINGNFELLDVCSSTQTQQAMQGVVQRYGSLDIAVNCAGTRHNGAAESISDDEWRQVFEINVQGVYRSCREQGKIMLEQGSGRIVNIASMSGSIVNRPQNQSAYNSSKAAVVMVTKSLAAEWASRGVAVNSVSPGYTATPMTAMSRKEPEKLKAWVSRTPIQRIADPYEIASAVLFLAAPAASFVVGHDLIVDGGYTIL